jgi:hypothetical protein
MSAAALALVSATPQVFDSTPPPDTLAACLAPFEDLIVGCTLESDLHDRLSKHGRIGLVGPSGCGKSSATRYALSQPGVAMLLINVMTEDATAISNVRDFLQILVSQLLARANTADKLDDKARDELLAHATPTIPLTRTQITNRAQLGGAFWLLNGGVAREVARQIGGGEAPRAISDLRAAASDALAIVTAHGLVPVIVADDADRLLAATDPKTAATIIRGFFGEVVREISEQLECGFLVAFNDNYRDGEDPRQGTAGHLHTIAMPTLTSAAELTRIVDLRASFLSESVSTSELASGEAMEALARLHANEHNHSIRRTLNVLGQALTQAAGDGSDLVGVHHISAAAAG